MKVPERSQGIDSFLLSFLEKSPVLSRYAITRGWHYVVSWLQRSTGVGLVIIVYLYLFSLVPTPEATRARMGICAGPIFAFSIWISSLITGFHALNGGRLILYELFRIRNDAAMIRWTFVLTIAYGALSGLLMIIKNRGMPAAVFWGAAFLGGVLTAYPVVSRIGKSRHSIPWKIQRISGGFLFIAVPAYLLLSFLSMGVADQAKTAAVTAHNGFVRISTVILAVTALYHAGYGLFSIAADYASSRTVRVAIAALIVVGTAALAVLALKILLSVS